MPTIPTLPDELLTLIFEIGCEDYFQVNLMKLYPVKTSPRRPKEFVVAPRAVCRQWSRIIDQTSTLWFTSVCLNGTMLRRPPELEMLVLREFAQSDLDIRVSINLSRKEDWNTMVKIIKKYTIHLARYWRSFNCVDLPAGGLDAVFQHLNELRILPRFRSLNLCSDNDLFNYSKLELLATCVPNLKYLRLQGFEPDMLHFPSGHLTHVVIADVSLVIPSLLELLQSSFHTLSTLEISCHSASPNDSAHNFVLSRLRTLSLRGYWQGCASFIALTSLPLLERLRVTTLNPGSAVGRMTSCRSRAAYPHLQKVLVFMSQPHFQDMLALCDISAVRELYLNLVMPTQCPQRSVYSFPKLATLQISDLELLEFFEAPVINVLIVDQPYDALWTAAYWKECYEKSRAYLSHVQELEFRFRSSRQVGAYNQLDPEALEPFWNVLRLTVKSSSFLGFSTLIPGPNTLLPRLASLSITCEYQTAFPDVMASNLIDVLQTRSDAGLPIGSLTLSPKPQRQQIRDTLQTLVTDFTVSDW